MRWRPSVVLIWHLVRPHVRWTRAEREQRLFPVCCQVQARLMARYPGYQTPQVHLVPEAVVEEVKAMVKEILDA